MLTGRESLLRIIGKRRRFLPNRRSLFSASSSSAQDCAVGCQNDVNVGRDSAENRGDDGEDVVESVSCPVCGNRIPGLDNAAINSHLDECLSMGNKRKLSEITHECPAKENKRKWSQVTLLELNFSRSKVKVHANLSEDKGNQISPRDFRSTYVDFNGAIELDNSNFDGNYGAISLRCNPLGSCIKDMVESDTTGNSNIMQPLPSEIEENEYVMEECLEKYGTSKFFIPTFIVGRRHGSRQELDPESRIYLYRDPQNVKDSNAIKVLYADSGYDNMLGYVPRELAQYLSPLIDKFNLSFEGNISSVPKDPRAAVPIQIVCNNDQLLGQMDNESIQDFKSSWRDVLRFVQHAKTNPHGTTRYQDNLVMLIQDVLKSNAHLFTCDEMSFLETFTKLSDDSQRLFARLYTRKGPWFRMSVISYSEITDCQQALEGLLEAGYVCSFPWKHELEDNSLEEVLNLLNSEELREALRLLNKKCNHGARKQDLIDLLLSSSSNMVSPGLQNFVLGKTGSCIRISPLAESLIWRAERLFFLNGEHDLSAFLLVDLGIVKYPAYRCIISEQIFSNRSNLLSYEEAIEISQIMIESLDENNSALVLRCVEISASRMTNSLEASTSSSGGSSASFLFYFSASWVYSKVVLLGVSFLEREKRYPEAISLLRDLLNTFVSDGRRGYWTLRLSVDLEHLGRVDESLQVAENGLLDPWVRAGSKVALQRRVLRLGKPPRRWKIPKFSQSIQRKIFEVHVQGRPLNCKTGAKSIFYGEDGEQCGVEQLALQYYAGEGAGWQGIHSETGIWLTIFGILMWDIIFADVPNVFRTKLQTAPLDLDTDSFYETRKSLIEAFLDKIRDGMAEEMLISSWESHFGTACRGVNWEKHTLSDLRAVVKCIGGHCLSSICRHLAQDYRSWSSGMPDLLLWRLHDCYSGEAKLVEVKGPRDRLSEQQRAWLLVLMDCGFNVEICKVTPAPVST